MTKSTPEKIRRSSADALKMVYYVIIGLAITVALHRTFVKDGLFVGFQCFTQELDRLFLLLALIFTICRFVHGASIHLDVPSNKRYKPLVDFVGFFFQASCFYLMALTLDKPITFSILFAIMLLADAIWLIVLLAIKYIEELSATVVKQWLWSDFLIVVLLIILCVIQTKVVHWVEFIILLIALVAAALDYLLNKNFYFPSSIPNQHG